MKRRDPIIIDELHRVREDIGKAHDFDARRIAATIRRHEEQNRDAEITAHGRYDAADPSKRCLPDGVPNHMLPLPIAAGRMRSVRY